MGALLAGLLIKRHNCQNVMPVEKFAARSKLPVPNCIHKTLTVSDIGNNEVVVIGDVHGCLHELQQIVSLALTESNDRCIFIFCGDITNKGPFSKDTLGFIQNLGDRAYAVRGNHDDHVLYRCYAMNNINHARVQAKILPNNPKYKWIIDLTDADMEYMKELPYTISIPHLKIIVVHAGLFPWTPLCCQDPIVMTKIRNLSGLDDMQTVYPEEVTEKGVAWASVWPGPEHVYFGHDARRRLQQHPYATGLDTGCVYGGQLTAVFASGQHKGKFLTVQSNYRYTKPSQDMQ